MTERGSRYLAYASILERVMAELHKENNIAPIIIAGIRELRNFPEYSDATVLFLDDIEVTGDTHFDHLLKTEMTELQNFLLGVGNE